MKVKNFICFILLLFAFTEATAQEYLVIRKKGSKRRYEYRVGDTFVYQIKKEQPFLTDKITQLVDSTIVMENNIILIEQILQVDIQNATSNRPQILKTAEVTLPTLGYGLLAIDLFNNTVVEGNEFSLDRGITTTSAVMVGTGYALKIFRKKRIKLSKEQYDAYIVGN